MTTTKTHNLTVTNRKTKAVKKHQIVSDRPDADVLGDLQNLIDFCGGDADVSSDEN